MPVPKGTRVGGRKKGVPNKVVSDLKVLARQYTVGAMAELARLAVKAESEQARVSAIKELLDRGYGKAAQPVTGADGEGPVKLSLKVRFVRD